MQGNTISGPQGAGTAEFIDDSSASLSYQIDFENTGTVPAQNVIVTEQLDPNLDWATFQLVSFSFGIINVSVPTGLTQYQTTVSYQNEDGSALNVVVAADFNVATGLLTWTFTSIDPTTGQAPTGVLDGFLPPENGTGVGEGGVAYTVQPNGGLVTGTTVTAQASIVLDTNPAISTLLWVNTIDSSPPSLVAGTTATFIRGDAIDPSSFVSGVTVALASVVNTVSLTASVASSTTGATAQLFG
jgi:uncharacterized repeat protein (TIGR01451 family)